MQEQQARPRTAGKVEGLPDPAEDVRIGRRPGNVLQAPAGQSDAVGRNHASAGPHAVQAAARGGDLRT